MKQYVIDQLRGKDHGHIKKYLDNHLVSSGVSGLYWLSIEEHLLNEHQRRHNACKPFCFAVELEPERLVCELLVRTRERVRCDCMSYATEAQRNWLFQTIDAMLQHLKIAI